jgi:hypothetical protein
VGYLLQRVGLDQEDLPAIANVKRRPLVAGREETVTPVVGTDD